MTVIALLGIPWSITCWVSLRQQGSDDEGGVYVLTGPDPPRFRSR